MKLLLDTCTFLWFVTDGSKLSKVALQLIEDEANDVLYSAVTSWEVALKHANGKLELPTSPELFLPGQRELNEFALLPIEEADLILSCRLPMHHRDPADRMLIAQAMRNDLVVITSDPLFHQYSVRVLW